MISRKRLSGNYYGEPMIQMLVLPGWFHTSLLFILSTATPEIACQLAHNALNDKVIYNCRKRIRQADLTVSSPCIRQHAKPRCSINPEACGYRAGVPESVARYRSCSSKTPRPTIDHSCFYIYGTSTGLRRRTFLAEGV